jgi:hypothetical protein
MTLHGSCLCGGVAFVVDLPFDRFIHCHCSRCRKATGTAHATNAVVKAAALGWLRGEELLARYDLPTAQSFATSFCRRCGSPLPHVTRSGREVIIPAGAFDDKLGSSRNGTCSGFRGPIGTLTQASCRNTTEKSARRPH